MLRERRIKALPRQRKLALIDEAQDVPEASGPDRKSDVRNR